MRVVQVFGSSAGGVARHVFQAAQELASRGHDVVIAGGSAHTIPTGVRHVDVVIADRPRPADVGAIRALRAVGRGADVVHAHGLRAGALAGLALVGVNTPLVVTLHNKPVGSWRVRWVSRVLEGVVARSARAVLGVSGDLVDRMRERGARQVERALVPAPAMVVTVPDGARDRVRAQIRAQWQVGPEEALLVTVARLAPQKGLDTLVDVAGALVQAGVRFRWVVVGDGPLRDRVSERVLELGVPVVLAGRRDNVAEFLVSADVVVQTPVWEGQPIAVQEALSVGVALVSTDAGGTREVTGDAAVLVPVGDVTALAREVAGLVASPARVAELVEASTMQYATLPTVEMVGDQLERTYCA